MIMSAVRQRRFRPGPKPHRRAKDVLFDRFPSCAPIFSLDQPNFEKEVVIHHVIDLVHTTLLQHLVVSIRDRPKGRGMRDARDDIVQKLDMLFGESRKR
jgi:hypothetical protein